MATKVYKPKRKISATESEEIKIPASSVDGLSTVATSGSYNDLSNKPTIPDVSGKLSKTENTGVNVLGTTKSTTTLGGNQLVAPNGIIFAGTASNAGLVTRGICGVSTPDNKGACSKENLYINYDGNNDFNAGRQVVLNAGAVGNHLGSNMYQYAVPRGDIVKAWVEAQGYAKTTQIPTVNNGTLTIQQNGQTVGTFTANQKDGTTANITVPTKASDVNALSLDGGTIKKSKTIKMDASANSDGANLKWGTVNSKNPYIGYASDQVDGTFVVGSLLGTNYASGLAIGGGSGNLLWKGTKVATTSDIPTNYVTTNTAQDITAEKKFLNTLIVGAKDDGSTGFKVIQGDVAGGDTLFTVSINGIDLDAHEHNIPLLIGGNAGTSGQVLTSQGAGNAPIWGDITKHGYTELTNEDLNTITEVGWYRAYTGHTCKNSPTTMGFVLSVERIGGTASPNYYIQQTITTTSLTAGMIYRRRSNTGSGTPTTITMGWSTYKLVGQNTDETFSGRKTFSNGINLNSSLQVNGSAGTAGQVLTSTGAGTPQWTTPSSGGNSVASVVNLGGELTGGNAYTVFDNSEEGSFIGMITCDYSEFVGGFQFEINDKILTCTPTSDEITLRVTIDRIYSGSSWRYYYTIVSNDGSINNSGFFSDNNSTMYISTNMGSSYYQSGVGVIIKKDV